MGNKYKHKGKKLSKKEARTVRLREGELTPKEIYETLHKDDMPDSIDDRIDWKYPLHVGCDCYSDGFGFGKVVGIDYEEGIVYCTFESVNVPVGLDKDGVFYALPPKNQ